MNAPDWLLEMLAIFTLTAMPPGWEVTHQSDPSQPDQTVVLQPSPIGRAWDMSELTNTIENLQGFRIDLSVLQIRDWFPHTTRVDSICHDTLHGARDPIEGSDQRRLPAWGVGVTFVTQPRLTPAITIVSKGSWRPTFSASGAFLRCEHQDDTPALPAPIHPGRAGMFTRVVP